MLIDEPNKLLSKTTKFWAWRRWVFIYNTKYKHTVESAISASSTKKELNAFLKLDCVSKLFHLNQLKTQNKKLNVKPFSFVNLLNSDKHQPRTIVSQAESAYYKLDSDAASYKDTWKAYQTYCRSRQNITILAEAAQLVDLVKLNSIYKLTNPTLISQITQTNYCADSLSTDEFFLKRERISAKLKYSRSPQYDTVSGGAALLFAGLLGFLITEKFGLELADSCDFYYLLMYLIFFMYVLRLCLFVFIYTYNENTNILLYNVSSFFEFYRTMFVLFVYNPFKKFANPLFSPMNYFFNKLIKSFTALSTLLYDLIKTFYNRLK